MVIEKNCGDGQFNYTKSIDFSNVLNKSNDEVGISGETDCTVSSKTGDVNITTPTGDVIIDSGSNIVKFNEGKDKNDAETQIGSGFNNLETFNMYTNLTSGEIVTTLEMDLQNLFTNPSTLVNPFTVDGTDYTTGGIICNEVATAEEYFYKITEAINGIVYKI
jgi:hypothetical protein